MRRIIALSVLVFAAGTCACAYFSWRWWLAEPDAPVVLATPIVSVKTEPATPDEEVEKLIESLKEPGNRVQYVATIIPGGEWLEFSAPMKELIRLGERVRALLHKHVNDPQIQNEIVLVLGAIGDRATVSLLIEKYPADELQNHGRDNPQWMKTVCFTFALTYLTGQPIGRSRYGADCNSANRELWQRWWHRNRENFVVPVVKPNATWVPRYPAP